MRTTMKAALLLSRISSSGAWTPLQLDGLQFWLDPYGTLYQDSALSTLADADGEAVGGAPDASGNDNLASASGTARPAYKPNGFGTGLPGLSFDGGDALDVNSLAAMFSGSDKPYTLVMSTKAVFLNSFYAHFGVGSDSSAAPQIAHHTNNTPNWRITRRDDANSTTALVGGTPDTSTHVLTWLFSGTAITLRVDGVAVIDNQALDKGAITTTLAAIGALPTNTGKVFNYQGLIGDVLACNRLLESGEIDQLESFVAPRCGLSYPFDLIELSAPAADQVFQRSSSTGDIAITGNIRPAGTYDVEARFNGGAWATIASGESGAFTATLSGQAQGQGTLEVRLVDEPTRITSVDNIGIGDVFIVAGQSNASGRGTNNQSYSHASLKAVLFGNDYVWKELADPYDSAASQTDSVSSDSSPAAAGSFVPLLATLIMADQGVPVAFVPAAKGGSGIASWLPDADHEDRTTLYGSMAYRAGLTGAKCVLWWQGETDAINAMGQATYNGHLDTIANAVQTDLGVKLMACKLQNSSGIVDSPNEVAINDAIGEAWADNANVLQGPDLSDIGSDDDYHLQTDAKLLTAAERWWAALEAAFYT